LINFCLALRSDFSLKFYFIGVKVCLNFKINGRFGDMHDGAVLRTSKFCFRQVEV